jgi:type IV secretory pathway TrbD component
MNKEMKTMLDSYLRNLLGVVLALVTTTMASAGVSSPLDFGTAEWLTVANGLWAAAVPTLLRYINKQDPAFGLVAEVAAKEVSKKLSKAAKKAPATAKKAATKKSVAKKTTNK